LRAARSVGELATQIRVDGGSALVLAADLTGSKAAFTTVERTVRGRVASTSS